jgi:hypothetical protein
MSGNVMEISAVSQDDDAVASEVSVAARARGRLIREEQ